MQCLPVIKYGEVYRPRPSTEINDLVKKFIFPSSLDSDDDGIRPSSNSGVKVINEEKTSRSQQRVRIELDAALALHNAGKPCKVKKSVVCAVKGWSRATLYRRIAAGMFPKPTKESRNSWWWIADVLD